MGGADEFGRSRRAAGAQELFEIAQHRSRQ
jgi:hypothetical protein